MEKATEKYGNNFFSTNKFFGSYILDNEKYPTKEEFINYLYRYHKNREIQTLPICIEQFIDEVFVEYEDIMNMLEPIVFI